MSDILAQAPPVLDSLEVEEFQSVFLWRFLHTFQNHVPRNLEALQIATFDLHLLQIIQIENSIRLSACGLILEDDA